MTPESAIWAIWVAWWISWLAAAAWSDRAVKAPPAQNQIVYRLLAIVGYVLMFGAYRHELRNEIILWTTPDAIAWAMAVVVLSGLLFTWWARIHLGRLWSSSVGRKADHHVVDTGPYGIVRHPIYTGIIVATIGTAAMRGTALSWIGMGLMTLGWVVKARLEERFLREQLGAEAYGNYAKRVPMLVPLLAILLLVAGCAPATQPVTDPEIAAFIEKIRAVDNHSHVNSTAQGDADADALPLDALGPLELPATLRPEHPNWEAGRKAIEAVPVGQGDKRPALVLDQAGIEVMLANRIAMGPGLAPPRFRWVSYVDALMLPLSNKAEAAGSPDREQLYPLEDKLLQRYLTDLKVTKRPETLDAYLKTVVTPVLESQRRSGCVAVKFEAAYLRSLAFDDASADEAGKVYAKFAGGGEAPAADYKLLQDFLFRYIAREAGRLGMAVHIHSFEGAGNYFRIADADPMLLERAFNDPALRQTSFVIVHGGGVFADHAGALLGKPNVYVDTSIMVLAYPPERVAAILRRWLGEHPDKVLFGTDASAFSADINWEVAAWVATKNARAALATALTGMIRSGEVTRPRAEQIATMVMRTNAAQLYKLGLR